jgi:hypothetical protein
MEDLEEMLIDSLIEQAKTKAKKLAEQLETEGQIAVPQLLAEETWSNNKGEEFGVVIILSQSLSTISRHMGMMSLQFYTACDGKFVIDNYMSGLFGSFSDTVSSEEFRVETEKFIKRLTDSNGGGMKIRISNLGTCAIQSLIVPNNVLIELRQIPKDCTLLVDGVVFEGIDAIKEYWRIQTDSSQPYIIERSQRFPCFDSSDYAYENRYFWNFLISRSKQEADKKAKSMEQLEIVGGNFRLVTENLPADMRPMVYYEDESTSMILAY